MRARRISPPRGRPSRQASHGASVLEELHPHAVGVLERDELLAESRLGAVKGHALCREHRSRNRSSRRHHERHRGDLTGSSFSPHRIGEGKEREDGTGPPDFISIVEVIDIGGIEIDGLLHQAQTEKAAIEVEVLLGVARQGGDVMDSQDAHGQRMS